ncbi:MAG: Endoribonuclease [Streptosporangiaceae bacterium]|nr:Endoribonuclease [Streptosporangiaceae bacterium]
MHLVTSPDAPSPAGTYSPGIISGNLLFIAGQGPFNAAGERVGGTFAEQLRLTFANLEAIATAAGTSLHNAVRLDVFLQHPTDWAELNVASKEFLTEPYPTRTTIQADLNGFLIEVSAVVEISAS